jgi:hypothetical protein
VKDAVKVSHMANYSLRPRPVKKISQLAKFR